ncbi:MAG: DUF4105 domain-containing protein [Bacteroidota bacterium]|nr:DUF4105 domain-containing protein [Bacteroidota bacterium]
MNKGLTVLFVLLIFNFFAKAQPKLSPSSEVSVLTCAPGDELYSTFGHSAIRVKDDSRRMDLVYNYGTFDFNTPNFYIKFTQGKLDYMLSISPYKYYIRGYIRDKREVREQILNLSNSQKQAVFDYLENNARPENKFYHYDFLFNNCATKVIEVLLESVPDSIITGQASLGQNTSFRLMLSNSYLQEKKWTRTGINLLMGLPADATVSGTKASFLPDYLESLISNTKIRRNGKLISIVKTEKVLYSPESKADNKSGILSPGFIFWSLLTLIILLTGLEFVKKQHFIEFDRYLLATLGLAGILFTYTWFGTMHKAMAINLNTIWAFPLHVVAAFILTKQNYSKIVKIYFKVYFILLISFLTYLIINPTFFDPIVLPVTLILLVRSFSYFRWKMVN